ncbi:MAG: hypothetical protein Q8906_15585, partial [Bacillota bacterium]|nr:hypothetical protein [Bacillota bacterium]
MENAYIFGSFRFAGFHLCNKLLEKGWEVVGIDLSNDETDSIAEEKKLEIGRNANFCEMGLKDLHSNDPFEQQTAVIISFYDLFMENQDSLFNGHPLHEILLKMLRSENGKGGRPVFLLPIQLLVESEQNEIFTKIRSLMEECDISSENAQLFYLPSMFGEWQPSSYLVQETFQKNHHPHKNNEREWMKDLIYVDDAISRIVDVIECGNSGSFFMDSGKTNYWEECLELLGIDGNAFLPEERKVIIDNQNATRI